MNVTAPAVPKHAVQQLRYSIASTGERGLSGVHIGALACLACPCAALTRG
jgi:hypothetical protein